MFVMTIGLLGLAALIPVGQAMMSRGAIDEQKAIVGRQALRELKIQGLLKPLNILDGRANPLDANRWVPADAAKMGPTFADFDAFCFDPLAIARHGKQANTFPATPVAGAPYMLRVWPFRMASAASGPTPPWPVSSMLAEQLCMSQDDLLYLRPDSGDQLAYPQARMNAAGLEEKFRTFEGNFTWMATAVREFDAATVSTPSLDKDAFTVSVVVFHRRALGAPGVINDLINSERTGTILSSSIAGLKRGGDARFQEYVRDPAADPLSLKPGRWVLLCANPPGTSIKGTPRGYFRWYRLRAANPVPGVTGGVRQWDISLAGPDWPLAAGQDVYVVAPEGVVGVYERTMRIERPSFFNGYQ